MTKLEAMTKYRWLFAHWLKAGGWQAPIEVRRPYEREMDALQSQIAYGPGPEWDAFIDTIPGYRQAWSWDRVIDNHLSKIEIPNGEG